MNRALSLTIAAFFPFALAAQGAPGLPDPAASEQPQAVEFMPLDAQSVDLEGFLWEKRPLVVFANSPADPAFGEQLRLLAARWPDLVARDVVVIADSDPAAKSSVRETLRPRGFSLVLIEKDGTVGFRKPIPWDVREITRAIDKMPLRREEIRSGLSGAGG
ncbi:DUF4174 domain-containing protein [Phaeovulum sp.]|uniref:DUF4174 domain-containing protein n=1 Tax=Phaeovulum sp. TaxID=2934796 RepID=UPI0039E4B49C